MSKVVQNLNTKEEKFNRKGAFKLKPVFFIRRYKTALLRKQIVSLRHFLTSPAIWCKKNCRIVHFGVKAPNLAQG